MKKIMSVVLALVLVSVMSVSVFAAGSVVAPIVKPYEGGNATYSQNASGTEFTFTVDKKDGYNFTGWSISGSYDIVSGSLTSETITVRFTDGTTLETASNTTVPKFEKIPATATTVTSTKADKTTSNKTTTKTTKATTTTEAEKPSSSPKTGDSMAMVAFAALALAGVIVSKKKLSK